MSNHNIIIFILFLFTAKFTFSTKNGLMNDSEMSSNIVINSSEKHRGENVLDLENPSIPDQDEDFQNLISIQFSDIHLDKNKPNALKNGSVLLASKKQKNLSQPNKNLVNPLNIKKDKSTNLPKLKAINIDKSTASKITSREYNKPWVQKKKRKNSVISNIDNNSEVSDVSVFRKAKIKARSRNSEKVEKMSARSKLSEVTTRRKNNKIDFEKKNKEQIEGMKYRRVPGQYTMFIKALKNMSAFEKKLDEDYLSFMSTQTEISQTELQKKVVDSFLSHRQTLQTFIPGCKIFSSSDSMALEFEIQSYESREQTYNQAHIAFNNILQIFFVPKEKTVYYSKSYDNVLTTNGKKISGKDTKTVEQIFDKKNATNAPNVVSIELLNGDLLLDTVTEDDINAEETLKEQLDSIRSSKDYGIGMDEGRTEHIQMVGLSAIRINIAKNFGYKKGSVESLGFRRMGFAHYDALNTVNNNLDVLKKNANNKIIDFEVGVAPYEGVDFKIGINHASSQLILLFSIPVTDMSSNTQKKIDLISNLNELVLSKYLFNEYIFFGYTQFHQEALYEFSFEAYKKKSVPIVKYAKVFKNLEKYTNEVNDVESIRSKCTEINNLIITNEFLGVRDNTKDIEVESVVFLAFKMNDEYRYVLTSTDGNILKKHSIFELWNKVDTRKKKNIKCNYHNDNYFTGIDLNEMYLISFFINESEMSKFKFMNAKPAEKKKIISNPESKVKPTKKINAGDLFKRRMII